MNTKLWSQYVAMDDPVLDGHLVEHAFDSVEDWDELELDPSLDADGEDDPADAGD